MTCPQAQTSGGFEPGPQGYGQRSLTRGHFENMIGGWGGGAEGGGQWGNSPAGVEVGPRGMGGGL